MLPPKGLVLSTKNATPKLAVKLFSAVAVRTVAEVEWRVKAGVRGMKNRAIENVTSKITHSPRNAKKVMAVLYRGDDDSFL
ncbi:hypothetical protein CR513_60019, partial [Mucuna pruriens]